MDDDSRDDDGWDQFIREYETQGSNEDPPEPWTQAQFKDWYFMSFRNSEEDCDSGEWFSKIFGVRERELCNQSLFPVLTRFSLGRGR